jgi:hypothetical protein
MTADNKRKILEGHRRWREANPDKWRNVCSKGGKGRNRKLRKNNPRFIHRTGKGLSIETKNGRERIHRLVLQQQLRRKLEPNEYVLHRNGNRMDNRPKNLEIFLRSERSNTFWSLNGRWSKRFDQCIRCHSRKYQHHGKGLCKHCYWIETKP